MSAVNGNSFIFNFDNNPNTNRALKLKGAINIEPMDSVDIKPKRKHVEIQPFDAEDDEPLPFASTVKLNDHER